MGSVHRDGVGHAAAGGFAPLLAVRVLTVVNDNVLRWLAIGLGKKAVGTAQVPLVLTIGTAGFVLPFVLLAWLAGFLADRHPKRTVIAWCKFAEILIAAAAAAAVAWGVQTGSPLLGLPAGLWLLLATVVLIGCQAALLAPSVIGTIPESVPADRLSSANGVFAMATLAATLAGMAGGSWLADVIPVSHSGGPPLAGQAWAAAGPAGIALVGLAAAGWLASLWLVPRPAADPHAPRPWNALARTCRDLAELFASGELAAAAGGIVFFWALAAVAQVNVDQFATESGASSQSQNVPLLVALVGGIGLGSLIAGRVSTRGVELGLVPVGAVLMSLGSFCLAACPKTIFASCPSACGATGATTGLAWWFAAGSLLLLGIGAGVFDVPLEAKFQERSPAPRRGALLAALNVLTFAGMFAASALYGVLRTPTAAGSADPQPLLSARGVFAGFGLLAAAAVAAAVYAAPRASLRLFVSSLVNTVYRFRVESAGLMPATGPAVVVANHLSWLDGFIVALASPRPVRLVVYGPNIKGRFMRMLADQWRFILFDPRPKSIGQALKTIQSGLAAGDVIGIFCEGGISRTGQILGFKRGLEWILERVEAPIVPLHIDGMWGSLLSFSEGRFFSKRPRLWRRPLTLTFGPALPVGTHPDQARLALQEITASAVRRRMAATRAPRRDVAAWRRRFTTVTATVGDPASLDWTAAAAEAEAFDGACLVRRQDRLLASLSAGDPLHDSLGRFGGPLLGIHAVGVDPELPPRALGESIARESASIWLARVEQVLALAAEPPDGGTTPRGWTATLEVVVMPIGDPAELPRAELAAARFREACGVEPVVAFAPREAGGLVAMNTPASRAAADHEVVAKAGTLGRVVNGVVVWPEAALRDRLGLGPPAAGGVSPGESRTLVIGGTLAWPPDRRPTAVPAARLLDRPLDVDNDGFLTPRP